MSVLVHHQGGRMIYTKGAPDVLIGHCSYILWEGKVVPFTGTLRQKVMAANESMAGAALRVLGMAYREVRPEEKVADEHAAESQTCLRRTCGYD